MSDRAEAGVGTNATRGSQPSLREIRWWVGPLLAAVALAFDEADRRIPFGVWTTGLLDEVAHLSTAALGLLVLVRQQPLGV